MIDSLSVLNKYRALSFERLTEENFSLLCYWLNQSHVRAFYQKEATDLAVIRRKYAPRIQSDSSIRCFIIYFKKNPIGYIQTYLVSDDSNYTKVIGTKEGASIDLYIGELAFLRKGLGWLIELKFLKEILFPIFSINKCHIIHEKANIAALKTSKKAGFCYVKDVAEDNKLNELLVITKEKVSFKVNHLFKDNSTDS